MNKIKNFIINSVYYKLPQSITEKIDFLRRKKYYDIHNIIFIHVPKSAGTSVSYAIYGQTLGHFKAKDISNTIKNFEDCFSFGLVRNPYDRVYSAYNFVKQNGTSVMGVKKNSVYQSDMFESFDSFVLNWLSVVDVTKEDYVFQPQYLFTHDDFYNQLVKKVWYVEDMSTFEKEFKELSGLNIKINHLNQTKENKKIELSDKVKEKIYEVYKKDFELFGYKK
ncbi:MAG: sulfotransferase family 2 domain-containing protein [Sulfurimonadaceae bacterium]|nr:sulfotransferase family protein [Candidatus Cloacimonadota bacterium]